MPHKIGKQGNIAITFQKFYGKKMSKTVWVHYFFIYPVFMGIVCQLLGDPSCRYLLAKTILEKEVIALEAIKKRIYLFAS